jgi:hypothetical protein
VGAGLSGGRTGGPAGGVADGLIAGALWFAAVFAAGFALGVARTLWLAPALGEVGAVAVELPVILGFAWWTCGRLIRARRVAGRGPRAAMGASAFALLMLAEAGLAAATGTGPAAHLAGYAEPARALGLAGQVVFGLMPLMRRGGG